MIIGIDDTDSRSDGGCTTYIAAVLVEKLKKYGDLADYPLLIRLNPNIRYKGGVSRGYTSWHEKRSRIILQTCDAGYPPDKGCERSAKQV
jgi:hypothetical protein